MAKRYGQQITKPLQDKVLTPLAVVIGTGPSLNDCADLLRDMQGRGKAFLLGCNDTWQDFELDCWLACDPDWHKINGPVFLEYCDQWHWNEDICRAGSYRHIEGRWADGLSTDPGWISFGHSSGWQLLNLAVHYNRWGRVGAPILLVGFDMTYDNAPERHYFTGVSDVDGEYPEPLRKQSLFAKPDGTGLLYDYKHIANQCERGEIPQIINCTPKSAMEWFPIRELKDYA